MAKKSRYRNRKKAPVKTFGDKFQPTLAQFATDFLKSESVRHALTKGEEREQPVRDFFSNNLPDTYGVVAGEAVDQFDQHSPQLDVMVYDRLRNFPFYGGGAAVIPAEALLVSVEVKSKLTRAELARSLKAAAKLKSLHPFRKRLAVGKRGKVPEGGKSRYFHCLFAYDSDLSETGWLQAEYARLVDVARDEGLHSNLFDRIYVLNRGLMYPQRGTGLSENPDRGTAMMTFYMHILRFMNRENGRRDPVPYLEYAGRMSEGWERL